jgi:hypothetical protein
MRILIARSALRKDRDGFMVKMLFNRSRGFSWKVRAYHT